MLPDKQRYHKLSIPTFPIKLENETLRATLEEPQAKCWNWFHLTFVEFPLNVREKHLNPSKWKLKHNFDG